MVREGTHQINISISDKKYQLLEKGWKASKTDKKMSGWMLDSTLMQLEKEDFLQIYAPYLEKITVNDNSIIIRDEKLRRIVEVSYKNKKFWCDVDEKDSCQHVHFALALPELAKLKKDG